MVSQTMACNLAKMIFTETSRDVGMVQCAVCISNIFVHVHMKKQLGEKLQEQGGRPLHATTHAGQHSLASRHCGYVFTIPTSGNIQLLEKH